MEQRVTIPTADGLSLEGGFTPGSRPGGGVVTHPHPLYGGSMDNNVVLAARAALEGLGLAALRFNFRGVGASGGDHGGGKPEIEDIHGAAAFLGGELPADAPIHLVGYSFGAAVAVRATMAGLAPASLVLVSPPVDFLSMSHLQLPSCPTQVIVGERDDFCSEATLRTWLASNTPADVPVVLLPHADHFYVGSDHRVRKAVAGFLGDLG